MPLEAKQTNRNYTVYGKINSPKSLLHLSGKQRFCLAVNITAGLFSIYYAHLLIIKK